MGEVTPGAGVATLVAMEAVTGTALGREAGAVVKPHGDALLIEKDDDGTVAAAADGRESLVAPRNSSKPNRDEPMVSEMSSSSSRTKSTMLPAAKKLGKLALAVGSSG